MENAQFGNDDGGQCLSDYNQHFRGAAFHGFSPNTAHDRNPPQTRKSGQAGAARLSVIPSAEMLADKSPDFTATIIAA
jgi:hypothetical protein